METGSQMADGESAAAQAPENVASPPETVAAGSTASGEPTSPDPPTGQSNAPRKAEPKVKQKAKEEVVAPVSTPKPQGSKSLAEVMKIDLRVRKRPRH
jgi:hypothetical protein